MDELRPPPKDIDFVCRARDRAGLRALFEARGYVVDRDMLVAMEGARYAFQQSESGLKIDVFVERLEFCHTIELGDRLERPGFTIPLEELLLQKLQDRARRPRAMLVDRRRAVPPHESRRPATEVSSSARRDRAARRRLGLLPHRREQSREARPRMPRARRLCGARRAAPAPGSRPRAALLEAAIAAAPKIDALAAAAPGSASACSGGRTSTSARAPTDGALALQRSAAEPASQPGAVTLFFASDLHGSEVCFRKFVNAAKFYGADSLILGGDITGKLVVPDRRGGGRALPRDAPRRAARAR